LIPICPNNPSSEWFMTEELHIQQNHLNAIRAAALEFAGIGFYNYQFDGTIKAIDRASLVIFEIEDQFPDPQMAVGRHIDELVRYTMPKAQLRAKVREHGAIHGHESEFNTLKGNRRVICQDSYLFCDETTGEESIQCVMRDITAVRQREEELRALQRKERERQEEIESELQLADQMQRSLLPRQSITHPDPAQASPFRLRSHYYYKPQGSIGGDLLDIRAVGRNRVALFIGDVMGHGVASALVSASIYGVLQRLHDPEADAGAILSSLSRNLCDMFQRPDKVRFVSGIYMLIDLEEGVIHYANAGHPQPILLDCAKREVRLLGGTEGELGPALGLLPDASFRSQRISLDGEAMLLMFTDGFYEYADQRGEICGENSVLELLGRDPEWESPAALVQKLVVARQAAAREESFGDDVCLVALRIGPTA
jgi:serine phosphatase RsbU (regulator of sigma subunit)